MLDDLGSFIELDIPSGKEYYREEIYGSHNVCQLNSCRSAIVHSINILMVDTVYLPLYECDTVLEEVKKYCKVNIKLYKLDWDFQPIVNFQKENSAIVVCNYFGIFGKKHFDFLRTKFKNIIIDNAQAFYSKPYMDCLNCYSPRKFLGVPDGGYVVGKNASQKSEKYPRDFSSKTASFLLERIEYGCTGLAYDSKKKNDSRIDISGTRKMSILTKKLLGNMKYQDYISKRKDNFNIARKYFDKLNLIPIEKFLDDDCVPYVYPLLIEKDGIIESFHENHIYQGHWWEYLVDITEAKTLEHTLSKYIIPITIDQRYSEEDIIRQYNIVENVLNS